MTEMVGYYTTHVHIEYVPIRNKYTNKKEKNMSCLYGMYSIYCANLNVSGYYLHTSNKYFINS